MRNHFFYRPIPSILLPPEKSSLELCAKFNPLRIFLYYCENGPTGCRLPEQIYNKIKILSGFDLGHDM